MPVPPAHGVKALTVPAVSDPKCPTIHDAAVSGSGGKPLVLTGDSGCGKSALLAEWVAAWRKDNADDLIIQHYIGSTPNSDETITRKLVGKTAGSQPSCRAALGKLVERIEYKDDPARTSGLHRPIVERAAQRIGLDRDVIDDGEGSLEFAEETAHEFLPVGGLM